MRPDGIGECLAPRICIEFIRKEINGIALRCAELPARAPRIGASIAQFERRVN